MTTHLQLKLTARRDGPPFRRRQAVRTACPQANESSERAVSLKGGPSGRAVGFLQGVRTGLLSEGDRPSGRPALKLTRRHNVPSA